MYKLSLTKSERDAIDWVGHRYANGNDFADLLLQCMPENTEWDDPYSITFQILEHLAWRIQEIADESGWTCFAGSFVEKLDAFLERVV